MKEKSYKLGGFIFVFIFVAYIAFCFFEMGIRFSEDEKTRIRDVIINHESYITKAQEEWEIVSDLNLKLKTYNDGSFLVANDIKGTLLYSSIEDTSPVENGPEWKTLLKVNLKYLLICEMVALIFYFYILMRKSLQENTELLQEKIELLQENLELLKKTGDLLQENEVLLQEKLEVLQENTELLKKTGDLLREKGELLQKLEEK